MGFGIESRWRLAVVGCVVAGYVALACSSLVTAQAPDASDGEEAAEIAEVELFKGLDSGRIVAKVVPHSYFIITLTLQNRGPETVKVKTPEFFAAVATKRLAAWRAAAQRGGGQEDYAKYYDRGGSQSLGGSFYYREQSGRELAGQGGAGEAKPKLAEFVLEPREKISVKVPAFCMEFGLPDPTPRIKYTLVPLKMVTRNRAIQKVLTEFGHGKHHQAVAQLAMWNVANGTTWQQLSQVRWPGRFGRVTLEQLEAAKNLADQTKQSGANAGGRP